MFEKIRFFQVESCVPSRELTSPEQAALRSIGYVAACEFAKLAGESAPGKHRAPPTDESIMQDYRLAGDRPSGRHRRVFDTAA